MGRKCSLSTRLGDGTDTTKRGESSKDSAGDFPGKEALRKKIIGKILKNVGHMQFAGWRQGETAMCVAMEIVNAAFAGEAEPSDLFADDIKAGMLVVKKASFQKFRWV